MTSPLRIPDLRTFLPPVPYPRNTLPRKLRYFVSELGEALLRRLLAPFRKLVRNDEQPPDRPHPAHFLALLSQNVHEPLLTQMPRERPSLEDKPR